MRKLANKTLRSPSQVDRAYRTRINTFSPTQTHFFSLIDIDTCSSLTRPQTNTDRACVQIISSRTQIWPPLGNTYSSDNNTYHTHSHHFHLYFVSALVKHIASIFFSLCVPVCSPVLWCRRGLSSSVWQRCEYIKPAWIYNFTLIPVYSSPTAKAPFVI